MNLRTQIRTVLLLLCAALPLVSIAAGPGSAEPPFRFYSVLDGLTQSGVTAIAQDDAGYLWIATARGLNRYDGVDFDHYTIADGMPTNSLTTLHVDDTNSIWAGDVQGGITIMYGMRIGHIIKPIDGYRASVIDIEVVGRRALAVIEDVGIVEISVVDGKFESKPVDSVGVIGVTNISVQGTDVWAVAESGLYRITVDGGVHLELVEPSIRQIYTDVASVLWVADVDGRVGIWKDARFEPLALIESNSKLLSIATDQSGLVWAVTNDELFSFNPAEQGHDRDSPVIRRYTGIEQVTSLFVDRENSLWLASGARLVRFLGDRFRHHRLRTSSDPETVWTIGQDRNGRIWFGTEGKLLMRESDESVVVVGSEYGVPKGAVRDLIADAAGDIWAGVTGAGLFHVNVDTMTVARVDGTAGLEILDLHLAGDGAVWFSTMQSGVFRYLPASDELKRFAVPEETSVYTLDIGPDGSVWYGADEVGLIRLTPTENGDYVQALVPGSKGLRHKLFDHVRLTDATSAWVALEEGGLYRYENGTFSNFGSATPLADQTVYLVEPLPNGSLVAGGEQGLYQFFPGDAGVVHFNEQAGFVGLETNVHATFVDSSGYLWIGTVDGATRMDMSMPVPGKIDPVPNIVHIETELDRKPIFNNEEIEPGQLGARVEFAAVSLLSPRGMEYSYKLVGIDNSWGPESTFRSVSYPRIPPGSYEFMVRARYPGGEWSKDYASHRFTVLPFFWQQWWFVSAVILLILLAFRAAMQYRTRKIEWLNETLRALVVERTRSIDQARQSLLVSNQQLSAEIEARAELEARFRRAFENAPIGMGLLDRDGLLFDANPALKNMFWPDTDTLPEAHFASSVCDEDREKFISLFKKLTASELDGLDEKIACIAANGNELQTVVNISSVKSDCGDFLYAVLQIQDVTESLKLTSQLEHQATSDELTGLLNRRAFETELQRAWSSGPSAKSSSYLMFMDLDQFKIVNDTSGHAAGDELLRSVSEILLEAVRANDIVARLGGDEFGVILWECPTEVATRIAESIRASIEVFRFHWDTQTYRIGVSIGGLPIEPNLGDISELQQLADAACYAAKEAGRNRVHMVAGDKDSARAHRGQVRWIQRIRDAMDNNRFAIYAQPIRCLVEGIEEPERLEILLRLRDPESRKLVPPGAFLPATERYGLSVELDRWVVKSLLDMLFVHQSFQANDRSYWINLSGTSIGDKRFSEFLIEAVKNSPLPPGMINFEITETAVIRNIADAGNLMASLREMGCKFALDDFGSGLSSFGYLKKLPVDYLKIDGMFIRDLLKDETDRIFVKSIIDIAHALNIKTIAEFIEDDETLALVRELGADYAQGFALGRPFVLAPQFPGVVNLEISSPQPQKKTG